MTWKERQFGIVEFKACSINLNAQHVNGMTHFDLAGDSKKFTATHFRIFGDVIVNELLDVWLY